MNGYNRNDAHVNSQKLWQYVEPIPDEVPALTGERTQSPTPRSSLQLILAVKGEKSIFSEGVQLSIAIRLQGRSHAQG